MRDDVTASPREPAWTRGTALRHVRCDRCQPARGSESPALCQECEAACVEADMLRRAVA